MTDSQGKKKALGRGLGALLEDTSPDIPETFVPGNFRQVRTDCIEANPFQPRTHFSDQELEELSASIKEHGIIQPLTLRRVDVNRYQLIAGERRLRASILAGLDEVPAFIRTANDEQMLEMALVENLQREELNPIEIAISFRRLMEECRIRQEELSKKVGKDRTTISNYIRLLKLPGEIQVAVRDNLISMGHARALISIEDEKIQLLLLRNILERKASVRQVEDMVRKLIAGQPVALQHAPMLLPQKYEKARTTLAEKYEAGIDLKVNRKGAGKIIIPFKSPKDFDRIIAKLDA